MGLRYHTMHAGSFPISCLMAQRLGVSVSHAGRKW